MISFFTRFSIGLLIIGLVGFACSMTCGAAQSALLDSFDDGDACGWQLVGDGNHMGDYSVSTAVGGCESPFALRVSMNTASGWCGVAVPKWKKLPVANLSGLSLNVRGNAGCGEICVDLQQTDGARWWLIAALPRDGSWLHINAAPEKFHAVNDPHGAASPDFTKLAAIWFSLRRTEESTKAAHVTPATMDIDNILLMGNPVETTSSRTPEPARPQSLKGITALLVDTSKLPALGQDSAAVTRIETVLKRAGAVVQRVMPGKLNGLAKQSKSVLVWEGPVCRDTDWPQVESFLKHGGALLWWGGGLPFSRLVTSTGKALDQTEAPALILSQSAYQSLHALQAESAWKPTAAGHKTWPAIPSELTPSKCRVLTMDDSTSLNNHWPWVDFEPLITVDYRAQNWVNVDNSPFTGSVASLFKHHSGTYAGARVLLMTMSSTPGSPMWIDSPLFAQMLTGAVRAAAQPINVEPALAKLPLHLNPVTRANFFTHPKKVMGALDFGATGWSNPEYVYAVKRLGMNTVLAGVRFLMQPDANGSVIDWPAMDKIVSDAETGGWGVIFDPYPFGYDRFEWARDAGGKTVQAASVYNPSFANLYKKEIVTLATRYAHRPAVVAIFATPDTGTLGFNCIDDTEVGKAAWAVYAAGHGLPADLPANPAPGEFDLSPARAVYIGFWEETRLNFMRDVIRGIRAAVPDMPILLRGPFMDVASSFRLASEFRNVAPYCECQETSIDVESYFRGFALRYGVPIAGENGWPKERGGPLRMAFATTMLGGYRAYMFSFGSPIFARPGLYDFEAMSRVWPALKGAKYMPAKAAMLVPDSTIWASNPPNFFSAEKRPFVEYFMERTGVPFQAVSAQWPKLDGISVLIDDGRNDVLCADSRQAIVNWVKSGGTLIVYPGSGRYDAAGKNASLADALGVKFEPGEMVVGKGKVVVLSEVPVNERHPNAERLLAALQSAGATVPVQVRPFVNQAVFTKGDKTYLVLFDKSRRYVDSFFNESTLRDVETSLPNLDLTITVPNGTKSVRELQTGKTLAISGGKVKLTLPATHWRVVEFSGSGLVWRDS